MALLVRVGIHSVAPRLRAAVVRPAGDEVLRWRGACGADPVATLRDLLKSSPAWRNSGSPVVVTVHSARMTDDYLGCYDLERYLFHTVRDRFRETRRLSAFDLFSIIIWKANRSKSKLAKRLIARCGSLDAAADRLSADLAGAGAAEERLAVLVRDWGFYLPMATSILSVLWPDEFTVYDVRVCNELGAFHDLGNKTRMQSIWEGYCQYRAAVDAAVPNIACLHDKDRFLWGRSAAKQLVEDIYSGFVQERDGAESGVSVQENQTPFKSRSASVDTGE